MAKILVIDDSPVMRSLLEEFLTESGHTVTTADNGESGVATALSQEFDICLCDLHMPKMNGYQVYCEVYPQCPKLHFIFTDSMPDELSERIHASSKYLCLRKPFDLNQVRQLINALLEPASHL
jgi:CheY-like chemotaxis protein